MPIYRGTQQFAWPYRLKIYAAAGGEVSARPCNELCHISMAQQRLWLSHVTSYSPQQSLELQWTTKKSEQLLHLSPILGSLLPRPASRWNRAAFIKLHRIHGIYLERQRLQNNRCNHINLCESFFLSSLLVLCINLYLYNAYASSAHNCCVWMLTSDSFFISWVASQITYYILCTCALCTQPCSVLIT